MAGKSHENLKRSSSISGSTSNDGSATFVVNAVSVRASPSKGRRGRPKKRRENGDEGKRTIFSWLINSTTIQENAKVFCWDNNVQSPVKEGKITRTGILCHCCNQVWTAESFQDHSARESNNKPYEKIFVAETIRSLLSYMDEAWNHPSESARHKFNLIEGQGGYSDTFDDACIICADGGELMCCDNCSSTYHHQCMEMEEVPENSWLCPYCSCKFCGNPRSEMECLITCFMCEKNYHWHCFLKNEKVYFDMNSPSAPLCSQSCKEVYDKLEKLIGVCNKLDDGYTWTLLRRLDEYEFAVKQHDSYRRTECHSKLAIAWSVMKDCFEPIIDRYTKIDVIQSIVYNCGSNYTRINFWGFYTAVLEKDGEIISVATLRIHGKTLAEMPFIATNEIHRCKGMCRRLMSAIEYALRYLEVENLLIPSVHKKKDHWIDGCGFGLLKPAMKKEIMCRNTLMFHDSVRLQKTLLPPPLTQATIAEYNHEHHSTTLADIDLNADLTEE